MIQPERIVHAKGAGAHGWFEVTTDVAMNYSMAKVFNTIGKRTPVTARLSTIAGNLGNADAVRDLRGLSYKYVLNNKYAMWCHIGSTVFQVAHRGRNSRLGGLQSWRERAAQSTQPFACSCSSTIRCSGSATQPSSHVGCVQSRHFQLTKAAAQTSSTRKSATRRHTCLITT